MYVFKNLKNIIMQTQKTDTTVGALITNPVSSDKDALFFTISNILSNIVYSDSMHYIQNNTKRGKFWPITALFSVQSNALWCFCCQSKPSNTTEKTTMLLCFTTAVKYKSLTCILCWHAHWAIKAKPVASFIKECAGSKSVHTKAKHGVHQNIVGPPVLTNVSLGD